MIANDVTVTGMVQGVGFRWFTRVRCLELGLAGWVRNNSDGSVAVHIEGEDDAIEAMLDWLAAGPEAAQVDGLEVLPSTIGTLSSFEIRR